MLKKVSFKNFKCLQDVTVDLEPLTVLIGPNNAGKTSFLQALDLFRQATISKAFESLLWNHRDSRLDQWVWMGDTA